MNWGYYTDKAERATLSAVEAERLEGSQHEIPFEVLEEFTQRRNVNGWVNESMVDLARDGIVDFLVIPLDDCAQYGWAAREQRGLRSRAMRQGLGGRVFMYSGADEVGMVLLARAVNDARGLNPARVHSLQHGARPICGSQV